MELLRVSYTGYVIVQGQSIPLIQGCEITDNIEELSMAKRDYLKADFEKSGKIIETGNAVFEKRHCSGLYVVITKVEYADNALKRWWKGLPKLKLTWK